MNPGPLIRPRVVLFLYDGWICLICNIMRRGGGRDACSPRTPVRNGRPAVSRARLDFSVWDVDRRCREADARHSVRHCGSPRQFSGLGCTSPAIYSHAVRVGVEAPTEEVWWYLWREINVYFHHHKEKRVFCLVPPTFGIIELLNYWNNSFIFSFH